MCGGGGSVIHDRLSGGSASALGCNPDKIRDRTASAALSGTRHGSDARTTRDGREDDSKSVENMSRELLPSRQSLLDLVGSKFSKHTPTHHYYHHQQQQVCHFFFTLLLSF